MEEIIRSQDQVQQASMNSLVITYNALTGKNIKKFENRSIAETRVAMAIMSAKDAHGHLGLNKGEEAKVLTLKEREELAASKGKPLPAVDPSLNDADAPNYEAMEAEADEQANTAAVEQPIEAPTKPVAGKKKAATGGGRKAKAMTGGVKATFAGKSKPREDSVRGQVLAAIQAAPNATISYAELEKKFGPAARGCVFKLLEKEHITLVE
jgi:hypothetical protein